MDFLISCLALSLGINMLMFVPAFIKKTDALTDISYALTFMVISAGAFALSEKNPLHITALILVWLWALRLGTYLYIRIRWMKRDKRFDGIRENFWRFLSFWLLQGISVFVILLAALLLWSQDENGSIVLAVLGIIIFATGLILETAADVQKFKFMKNPQNKGAWIQSGVWRMSRHPNYLGEIMVWCGIWLVSIAGLSGIWAKLIALISPLFITLLLLFISGIPKLEKSADERWGNNKAYQAYKRNTPVLIPSLRSARAAISHDE